MMTVRLGLELMLLRGLSMGGPMPQQAWSGADGSWKCQGLQQGPNGYREMDGQANVDGSSCMNLDLEGRDGSYLREKDQLGADGGYDSQVDWRGPKGWRGQSGYHVGADGGLQRSNSVYDPNGTLRMCNCSWTGTDGKTHCVSQRFDEKGELLPPPGCHRKTRPAVQEASPEGVTQPVQEAPRDIQAVPVPASQTDGCSPTDDFAPQPSAGVLAPSACLDASRYGDSPLENGIPDLELPA